MATAADGSPEPTTRRGFWNQRPGSSRKTSRSSPAVTDGRQALIAARLLDPDAIVLDITMPELDGFQTARELKRSGRGRRSLFLTMHDEDEFSARPSNLARGATF